jgi:hypothetical protein
MAKYNPEKVVMVVRFPQESSMITFANILPVLVSLPFVGALVLSLGQ